jgi:hypothetical protein
MNDILLLKGTLQRRPHAPAVVVRNMPKNAPAITSKNLLFLAKQLQDLKNYWSRQSLIKGCLIDVCYIDVIAKSNRISGLLSNGSGSVNDSVVGARFAKDAHKHIITHYVSESIVESTIGNLNSCIKLLDKEFNGSITQDDLESERIKDLNYEQYGIGKTRFRNIIVDTYYVEGFKIPDNSANISDRSIITIYRTDAKLEDLMKSIGITVQPDYVLSDTTLLLYPEEIKLLEQKAPYLIAMATEDISQLSSDNIANNTGNGTTITIPAPTNEPTIGVIDTLFDGKNVYFSEWVDFRMMIDPQIPVGPEDYVHGTAVSSLIVDGPSFNPDLDDGCGRFKVRHFGVTTQGKYSAFSIMKKVKEIVVANPDIKVWNLSLGSDREINLNFISPEADILDRIQYENDVIFIVAGTNKRDNDKTAEKRIGSPADSINSIVVNSVDSSGKPASYTRKGLVLSFFNKPDVSSYGGDTNDYIRVCTPTGEGLRSGTSFAAPWVTRKVAYLIEVLGLSREVAKAMIVDSATGWNSTARDSKLAPFVGHGVVPRRIEDVMQTSDDEIKFIFNDVSENWDTYTYHLPVPIHKGAHPFIAKATLCYFPSCSINQGVDYTDTELDIYLGRMKDGKIKTINENTQSSDDGEKHYMYEGNARKLHRKWDNVKHIRKPLKAKVGALKVYDNDGLWGLSIKAKERLGKHDEGIKFGIVVTLKEIKGVNRINDFIHRCELRGWLVNRVNVGNRIDIFNKAQEAIVFEN